MCFKYESEYKTCFDYAFMENEGFVPTMNMGEFMLDVFGAVVDFENNSEIRYELFKVFDRWHEEGLMRPATDKENGEREIEVDGMIEFLSSLQK